MKAAHYTKHTNIENYFELTHLFLWKLLYVPGWWDSLMPAPHWQSFTGAGHCCYNHLGTRFKFNLTSIYSLVADYVCWVVNSTAIPSWIASQHTRLPTEFIACCKFGVVGGPRAPQVYSFLLEPQLLTRRKGSNCRFLLLERRDLAMAKAFFWWRLSCMLENFGAT